MQHYNYVISSFGGKTSYYFFFSSRRLHTSYIGDWSSDVCSSDLRLFELTQESMNRCTLVNGLRLQLGAVVASSWFIDELRIAHGPQLIPMSARSGTYKQLQRTVMHKVPRHIGQRAAAELRR